MHLAVGNKSWWFFSSSLLVTNLHIFLGVFWVNIVKSKLNLLYRYCLKLIRELRKEKEFRQQCCQNSTKIGERKRKRWREKEEEFRQHCYRNSSAQIPARPVSCVLKKSNCSNAIAEIGKKRNFFFDNCSNGIAENGKKIEWNYGNVIAEYGRKKKYLLPKSGKKF